MPNDVREAVWRAVATVDREGASLTEVIIGDQVALAVQGQPAAVYVSPSRVSVALEPVEAERAHRSDSAIGLDKEGETTWVVHCRFGRLDSSRLNSMTALMVKALRRYAPRPEPRVAAARNRRQTTGNPAASTPRKAPAARAGSKQREEDRRNAADAAVPRCPVPGCNLPMVGGSCGFHD